MAARGAALERLGTKEFEALLAPEGGAPDDGQTVAAASEPTVLVLLDRGGPEDQRVARVMAKVGAAHRDRLRVAAVDARSVSARLESWQAARRAYDTFDFQRWPAACVFRAGRLITTFHPRRVFFPEALQEREEAEQLEIFLAKMVYYDPDRVKEQKSLQLEAEA